MVSFSEFLSQKNVLGDVPQKYHSHEIFHHSEKQCLPCFWITYLWTCSRWWLWSWSVETCWAMKLMIPLF